MRMVAGGILCAMFASGQALAAELVRNPCHDDLCTWFSVEDRQTVGTALDGALVKSTIRRWRSVHPGGRYDKAAPRGGGESTVSHFFCSVARPTAMYWDQNTGWKAVSYLPINGPSESLEPAVNEYLSVCHGVHVRTALDFRSVAWRYGYKFYQADQREVVLASPDEILTSGPASKATIQAPSTNEDIQAILGPRAWPGKPVKPKSEAPGATVAR